MTEESTPAPAGRGFGSRLAGDAVVYGLGGMANQAVAILLVPVYARALGAAGVGVTGVLNSVISLSLMVVGLALPQAFFRWYLGQETGDAGRARVLATTFAIRLAASLGGCALVLLASVPITELLYGGEHRLVFALAAAVVLFDSFTTVPLSFLRAERRPRDYVVISISRAVTGTILILLFVVGIGTGVVGVPLGGAIAAALSAVVGGAALWRAGLRAPRLDPALARAMLAFSLPFVPAAAAGWALNLGDRPLLQAITGDTALVGVYTMGYTAGLVINALAIQPFNLAWSAAFWEISRSGDGPRTIARSLTWFVALAAGAALFLSAIGTDALRLLVGPEFEGSRFIVPFSAFAFVLYGVYTIGATGLSIVGRSGPVAMSMIVAAVVALVLNLVLIPELGMFGAAISTVAGYALLATSAGWQSQRHYPVPWQLTRVVAILGLAAGLSALALIGPDHPLWRIGCLLLYPPILIGTRIVHVTQARQLLRAVRGR